MSTSKVYKKPVLAIDVDEVLALFIPSLAVFHNEQYGTSLESEHFVSYEFHHVWGGTIEECSVKMELFFESHHFKERVLPVPGAFECLNVLKKDFELHIVTARQLKQLEMTKEWINYYFPDIFTETHFGNHYSNDGSRSRSKAEMCAAIDAVMLIDDNPKYAKNVVTETNTQVVLFGNYAWNRDEGTLLINTYKNLHLASSWNEVTNLVYSNIDVPVHCIAAIQMTSSNDKQENIRKVERFVKECSAQSVVFCSLPECCLYIGESAADTIDASEIIEESSSLQEICKIAKQYNMYVSIGGFPERRNAIDNSFTSTLTSTTSDTIGSSSSSISSSASTTIATSTCIKISNTHIMISPDGNIVTDSHYRKMHMFDSPRHGLFESKSTEGGTSVKVVSCSFANVGPSICYDLRFPEIYSALRRKNAEIITVSAAFTVETGRDHWEVLLRARAIETQCYIIAAAQIGKHNNKRSSYGSSMIISPWGEVLARGKTIDDENVSGDHEGIIVAKFSRKELLQLRVSFPVYSHRKNDYHSL